MEEVAAEPKLNDGTPNVAADDSRKEPNFIVETEQEDDDEAWKEKRLVNKAVNDKVEMSAFDLAFWEVTSTWLGEWVDNTSKVLIDRRSKNQSNPENSPEYSMNDSDVLHVFWQVNVFLLIHFSNNIAKLNA